MSLSLSSTPQFVFDFYPHINKIVWIHWQAAWLACWLPPLPAGRLAPPLAQWSVHWWIQEFMGAKPPPNCNKKKKLKKKMAKEKERKKTGKKKSKEGRGVS